jgi:hypothetical protein
LSEGQEVSGRLLVTRRHSAVMLEAIDEAFDQVTSSILPFIVASADAADFQRRYDDFGVAPTNRLEKRIAVVRLVGDHGVGTMVSQQFGRAYGIVFLARTEQEFHRTAAGIAS